MMRGTNPIIPQGGTYTTPVAGDIVYFQHDTFPPEVGVVTTATLTSGTFAVNNFTLMGGQTIVKFATPQATGLVTASTNLNVGDLVVVNSTSSPTSDRYAWHIVTTGAAVNNSALRLDGASAAPAYASGSSFSMLTPTATSSVNSSTQLTQGLNFVQGDLVFAKVTAGGDNLNTYAWHLVTTAENVGAGATSTTLRLDGASTPVTFAASTAVAKLSPGAEGLATDTTTALANGDIIFANTTANASNNNAYNFHLVTSAGTGAASSALRLDNSSSNLQTGTSYVLTVGTGVKDKAGNPLGSAQTVSFSTGSVGGTNTTPPFVQSSLPQSGNQSFPLNAPIKLTFSVDMLTSGGGGVTSASNVGLFLDNFGAPG